MDGKTRVWTQPIYVMRSNGKWKKTAPPETEIHSSLTHGRIDSNGVIQSEGRDGVKTQEPLK